MRGGLTEDSHRPTWASLGSGRHPVRRHASTLCATRNARSAHMDAQTPPSLSARQSAAPETVAVRPLLLKPQYMNGLSERLLVSHYVNNYGGALRRLNGIRTRLAGVDWAR